MLIYSTIRYINIQYHKIWDDTKQYMTHCNTVLHNNMVLYTVLYNDMMTLNYTMRYRLLEPRCRPETGSTLGQFVQRRWLEFYRNVRNTFP